MKQGTLLELLNDMKHGVYNFTKDGKCTKCGNCCTALLPMTKDELKAVQRYVKRKHIQIVKHSGGFDLTCPFRNDELGICTVYEVRPQICRDFQCDKPQKICINTIIVFMQLILEKYLIRKDYMWVILAFIFSNLFSILLFFVYGYLKGFTKGTESERQIQEKNKQINKVFVNKNDEEQVDAIKIIKELLAH